MLAAPTIEGTLPAFYNEIKIPFQLSRAVSNDQVYGLSLKLKNLQGNQNLLELITPTINYSNLGVFALDEKQLSNLTVGNYYKVQIACVDEKGKIGYYSNVGVIKYTANPTIEINYNKRIITGTYSNSDSSEKLESYCFQLWNDDNMIYDFGWMKESYLNTTQFNSVKYLGDLNFNKVVYKIQTINGLKASQNMTVQLDIDCTKDYYQPYQLKIIDNVENGYVDLQIQLTKTQIVENEKTKYVYGKDSISEDNLINKKFKLLKQIKNSNEWIELKEFVFDNEILNYKLQDFNVKSGISYNYVIWASDDKDGWKPTDINTITPYFDHIYLCDTNCKQLKIAFNPKVSSFKRVLQEQKIETIGSQYPFIMRNGAVDYKEFPISGLISYEMDDKGLFNEKYGLNSFWNSEKTFWTKWAPYDFGIPDYANMQDQMWINIKQKNYITKVKYLYVFNEKQEYELWTAYAKRKYPNEYYLLINNSTYWYSKNLPITYYILLHEFNSDGSYSENKDKLKPVSLTKENVNLEKEFKLEVLDWLTNGEPKLFKSPKEGNYMVRLMNVSLSPNDTLGRMLHTFTATAYEISDNQDQILLKEISDNESIT